MIVYFNIDSQFILEIEVINNNARHLYIDTNSVETETNFMTNISVNCIKLPEEIYESQGTLLELSNDDVC